MDKYVRHTKRRNDDPGGRPSPATKRADVCEFYLPGAAAGSILSADLPAVPGTPKKTRPPDVAATPPPPLSPTTEKTEQSKRLFVARRLFFDDDITDKNVKQRRDSTDDVNDSMDNMKIISHDDEQRSVVSFTTPATTTLNESQPMDILEKKTTQTPWAASKDERLRTVVESLSDRGFVVINGPGQSAVVNGEDDRRWPTATADCDDGGDLYECLSVFEGVVYGVLVAAANDGSAVMAAVGALSAISPHPHVVAYHSCWTDGRYHYAQMEFCPDDLLSAADRPDTADDCRTVLEHVACALHYLHDCKGYAHNRVSRRNIHPVSGGGGGGGGVAYKLGGFHGVARLSDAAADLAFADVRALCSAVSLLVAARADSGDEDALSLRAYLSCVTRQIDSARATGAWTTAAAAGANALGVWRWCCAVRLQRRLPPSLQDDEMAGGADNDDGGQLFGTD